MSTFFIYPIYTGTLVILTYALVPRQEIRRLSIYGITFGAVTDAVMIIVFTHLLGVGGYLNYGPFGFMGIPFFPLFAWTAYFILYLYLLPKTKMWVYIYLTVAAFYSVMFSNVLQNLGIFKWNYGRLFVPFLIYIGWHLGVTLIYRRILIKL